MKKWYQWFILALIFALGGVLNFVTDKQIIASVIQVCITVALGFIQFFCERKGEKGKKIFGYITTAALLLLIGLTVFLALGALQ